MKDSEKQKCSNSKEILKLIEKAKHTNASIGGFKVCMIILLSLLFLDIWYYNTHEWIDIQYDEYTSIIQTVIFFYTTIYIFKGTEGERIIYGWRRWVLGCIFALLTALCILYNIIRIYSPREKIHAKTDLTQTEMRELKQSYIDAGLSKEDYMQYLADLEAEQETLYLYDNILYFISCIGLIGWTKPVKEMEMKYKEDEGTENSK